MGDWKPDLSEVVNRRVYLWVVPAQVGAGRLAACRRRPAVQRLLAIEQTFQEFTGHAGEGNGATKPLPRAASCCAQAPLPSRSISKDRRPTTGAAPPTVPACRGAAERERNGGRRAYDARDDFLPALDRTTTAGEAAVAGEAAPAGAAAAAGRRLPAPWLAERTWAGCAVGGGGVATLRGSFRTASSKFESVDRDGDSRYRIPAGRRFIFP